MKKALASAKYRTSKMMNSNQDDTDDKTSSSLKEESRRTHEHKTHLKEAVRRLQKQVKATSVEIEESSAVEAGFKAYYEQQLSEYDGRDYAELIQRISEILLAIDTHKKKMNDILSDRTITGLQELLDKDIKAATNSQKKYDRLKFDYEAAEAKVKSLKPKDSAEKRAALEKERDELRDAMDKAGKEALNDLSLTNAKIQFTGMTEFMRIFITYKEYFTRVSTQLNKIEPEMSSYRRILDRKREDFYKTKETSTISTGLFGAPLEDITTREGNFVPAFISTSCAFLMEFGIKEEGIFRLTPSMSILEQYRNIVEKAGKDIDYSGVTDPHIVSCLLKQFLREMPEPLMTFAKYPEFRKAGAVKDVEEKVLEIKKVVEKLPEVNFLTLKDLMDMSAQLAAHKDVTKMGSSNLAVVLGPNILYPRQSDPQNMTEDIEIVNNIVATMIDRFNDIFAETDPFKAAERGDVNSLQRMQSKEGMDLYKLRDEKDDKDLLGASADAGRLNVVKYLIEDCAWEDINRQDKHGMTPVFRAVNQKREKVALYLASKGANVEIPAKNGATVWDKIPSHADFYRKLSAVSKTTHVDRSRPKLTLNAKGSFVMQPTPAETESERSHSFSMSDSGKGSIARRQDRSSTTTGLTSSQGKDRPALQNRFEGEGANPLPSPSSRSTPSGAPSLASSGSSNDASNEPEREGDKEKEKEKEREKEKSKEKKEKPKEKKEKSKSKENLLKDVPTPRETEPDPAEVNPIVLLEPYAHTGKFFTPRRQMVLRMDSFASGLAQFSFLLKNKDIKTLVTTGVRVLFQSMKNWFGRLQTPANEEELFSKSTNYQALVSQSKLLGDQAKTIIQDLKACQDHDPNQMISKIDQTTMEFIKITIRVVEHWETYRQSCLKVNIQEGASVTTRLLQTALGVSNEPLDSVRTSAQTILLRLLVLAQERSLEIPNPAIQTKILTCKQVVTESTEHLIEISQQLLSNPTDEGLKTTLNQTAKQLAGQFSIISSFCSPSPFYHNQIRNYDAEHSNNNYYNLVNEHSVLTEAHQLFSLTRESAMNMISNPRDQVVIDKTLGINENVEKILGILGDQRKYLEESGIATLPATDAPAAENQEIEGKILPLPNQVFSLVTSTSQQMISIVEHCLKQIETVADVELKEKVERNCHAITTYCYKMKVYGSALWFLNRANDNQQQATDDVTRTETQIRFGDADKENFYQNSRTVVLFSLYGSLLTLSSFFDTISELLMIE